MSMFGLYTICLAISWSVVATDVEREYHDEGEVGEVGEVKRGDKARDAAKK